MPVFVRQTDERVWCLSIISDLLEQFLDENLWHLFDADHMASEALPQIKEIVKAAQRWKRSYDGDSSKEQLEVTWLARKHHAKTISREIE